jgi:hypothetical protein
MCLAQVAALLPPYSSSPLAVCLAVFYPAPLIPGPSIASIPVETEHPSAREDAGGLEEVGQG